MGVTAARPDTAKAQALGRIESEGLLVGDLKSQRIKNRRIRAGKEKLDECQKAC